MRESHIVIQHRVVIENLDAIEQILIAICRGDDVARIPTEPAFGPVGPATPDSLSALEAGCLRRARTFDPGPYPCCFMTLYAADPRESGFASPAADRYKLSVQQFDAQLAGLAQVRADAPVLVRNFPEA